MSALQKLDRLKSHLRTAESLRTLASRYDAEVSQPRCDKHNLRFVDHGDKFSCFSVHDISLECYTGYFGNSGCSSMACDVTDEYAQDLFIRALNHHLRKILSSMAHYAKCDASELLGDAEEEISRSINIIKQLKTSQPTEASDE